MSHLNLLTFYAHLTDRDRAVLSTLDEHRVMTTDQLTRLHFPSTRTCQNRLRALLHLGLLDRFRYARTGGGAYPWNWVLGLHGAWYAAGTNGYPLPTQRTHRDRILRLSTYPRLRHQLMTNEFGVRLAHAAHRDSTVRLQRWWSERTATSRFLRIRPDAHGLWTAGASTVGWFLECDMGTESLPTLIAKLDAYRTLAAAGGPAYPVLFWLPNAQREANLQTLLRRQRPEVAVATAVHDSDPAGRTWTSATVEGRVGLVGLPSSHGLDTAANPNYTDGHLDLTRPDSRPGPG
ncbi:replication-relaxation family protein [Actinoplanes sp. DH11]|uniref:replication-relaxation family protein n=1 Tax=Actinoplanes sp. DH11 TaxID=2857011 RepID=UPI001E299E4B|nr:replication-relaxation family protein [Actinoplanes sp. DH11]